MKLLAKVALITLGGIVLTTAVAGYFVLILTRSALQTTVKEKQEELGRQTLDRVDRLLYERYIDIQGIAEEEGLEKYLTERGDRTSSERRMNELRFLTGPWDVLFVADKNGVIILSTDRKEADASKKVQDEPRGLLAFTAALKGKPYYSDVVISDDTGRHTVIFAAPVRDGGDPKKAIVGVVVANLSWPAVAEILFTIPPPLTVHMHDKNGVMIAANERALQDMLFRENFGDHPAIARALRGETGSLLGPGMTHTSGSDQAMEMGDAVREALVSFVPESGYLGFRGNDWVLSIETPAAVAFAPAANIARNIVFLILPIIFLAATLTLLFLRRFIIRPIADFNKITQSIADGDLTKRAAIKSKDEVGELAASFNVMTDKVQSSLGILKAEKDKMETLIESIGDGVMAIDTAGKIILWNNTASLLTGYSKEEATGKHFRDVLKLVREQDHKDNSGFIDSTINEKTVKTMENHTLLIKKGGGEIPVGDSAAPIFGENNKVSGAIVVFRDVGRERELDRAKDEFVSLASHQLRTPLTAIKGYSGMLLDEDVGKINEQQRDYLSEIKYANERMVDLVNALLNTSRIDLGVFSIEPVTTDLKEIVESVSKELAGDVTAKRQEVKKYYDEKLVPFNLDPNLTRIIFQNLLSNAVKYTPNEGKISVSVAIQGPDVHITVSDNGYGIPKDAQPKIFKKLFRADNTRVRDADGTGLGLYVVKAVVEESGGKIWFESEENKGTAFHVIIPFAGMKKRGGEKGLR